MPKNQNIWYIFVDSPSGAITRYPILEIITSISGIEKVYETGSRPMRLYGSDFKHYIAKFGKPHDLLNELIAARFCALWDIRVPPSAFIRILPEHLPAGFDKRRFEQLGFGSEYLEYAQEFTNFILTWKNSDYDIGRIVNRGDFLRIGLFDLWLANDDRNYNNPNLLIQPQNDGFYLVAIDHVNIFNGNALPRGLYHESKESSILCSPYMPLLFRINDKFKNTLNLLGLEFEELVEKCRKALPSLLQEVPAEWGIDIAQQEEQMRQLFTAEWIGGTINHFRLYIAQNFW